MARTPEVAPKERGKSADLMRVMARQRGRAPVSQQLQPYEILNRAFLKQVPQKQAGAFTYAVTVMAKRGLVKPLQIGNTVFLLFPKGDGVFEFHMATEESVDRQAERFKALAKAAKSLGGRKLVSFFQDPVYNRVAQITGLPWKISMSQQVTKAGAQPAYRAELDL